MISSIKNIINFYISAHSATVSPSEFLDDFKAEVMDTTKDYYIFQPIEYIRERLKASKESITMKDFGAGKKEGETQRKISEIAAHSLSSKLQCRLLFNLIHYYKTEHILEMGTSLGISTMYLAAANTKNKVLTLEGNPASARLAQHNFKQLNLHNINVEVGEFSKTLTSSLEKLGLVDLAFIDGNHRYEPTLKYYHEIKKYVPSKGMIILDDIYWSDEMNQAWNEVKASKEVVASIDLYYMGILFFDPDMDFKEHVRLAPKLKEVF